MRNICFYRLNIGGGEMLLPRVVRRFFPVFTGRFFALFVSLLHNFDLAVKIGAATVLARIISSIYNYTVNKNIVNHRIVVENYAIILQIFYQWQNQ